MVLPISLFYKVLIIVECYPSRNCNIISKFGLIVLNANYINFCFQSRIILSSSISFYYTARSILKVSMIAIHNPYLPESNSAIIYCYHYSTVII